MTAKRNLKTKTKRMLIRLAGALLLLALSLFLFACTRTSSNPPGPAEKVTIAYSATTDSVLAQVAQMRGFYRDEGLDAVLQKHPYGKLALKEVLEGKADFATVAETPVMFAVMNGEKLSIIATIQTSGKNNAIIARRDRGILTFRDLKGKKIAATLGTTSEFYMDAILIMNGISRKDVKVINLKAEEMPAALSNGDIDAVSAFIPYTNYALNKLGGNGIMFSEDNIYTWTFNVVSTQDFIRKNPGKVGKLLRALIKAEVFVKENPDEAQKIVADFSGMDISIVRNIWADTDFTVTLDQSLLLALEDESRWAIDSKLTTAKKVPNYLDYIYFDGLKSAKPGAANILR